MLLLEIISDFMSTWLSILFYIRMTLILPFNVISFPILYENYENSI